MDRLPDLLESVARLRVKVAGVLKGVRREIDFTSNDSSVVFTATDDGVNEKLTLDLSASGGGGSNSTDFLAAIKSTSSVAAGTYTTDWTSVTPYDHSGSTVAISGATVTVTAAGFYVIHATAYFSSTAGAGTFRSLDASDTLSASAGAQQLIPPVSGASTTRLHVSWSYWLPINDVLTFKFAHDDPVAETVAMDIIVNRLF